MADDGAVDHHEEWFRDKGAESGQREGDDLPVVAAPPLRLGGGVHKLRLIVPQTEGKTPVVYYG